MKPIMTSAILGAVVFVLALNLASALEIWPDITCHKWYDNTKQKTFMTALAQCYKETSKQRKLLVEKKIVDRQGCMLWRMRGLVVDEHHRFEFVTNKGLRKTLGTIFSGLLLSKFTSQQTTLRRYFMDRMIANTEKCKDILNELANVKKLPSSDWGPFYDCISTAWRCGRGVAG